MIVLNLYEFYPHVNVHVMYDGLMSTSVYDVL